MSEPVGLSMSLDDLIKKKNDFTPGSGRGRGPSAGRGPPLGVRGGGIQKPARGSYQQGGGGFGGRGRGDGFQGNRFDSGDGDYGGAARGRGRGRGFIPRGGFQGRGGRDGGGFRQPYQAGGPPAPPAVRVETFLDEITGNVLVRVKVSAQLKNLGVLQLNCRWCAVS
jgi:hypothetical protein